MSVQILINVESMETRVAIVEQGRLQEVMLERGDSRGIVGNIYKGKVVRVMPGMQAAFVDIGRDKAGFLHASDIVRMPVDENGRSTSQGPDIRQLLHDGQRINVQAYKEPIGTKGPRLTTQLSLSSRYLVSMPGQDRVGISQKIDDEQERERLKACVEEFAGMPEQSGGYIVRTLAEGVEAEELHKDIDYLKSSWKHLNKEVQKHTKPGLIHEDLLLPLRVMRDIAGSDVEKVSVDDQEVLSQMISFCNCFNPEMVPKLSLYTDEVPLYAHYLVDDEISKALERRVPLISGGSLVIDQTEAMTTIDVNTGAFVGHRNLEDTIFKTNMEAVFSIARQLRLRNLGGIIIVDLIDMEEEEHQREVLRVFEKALAKDRAKTSICAISPLGLVEMTRKRTSESLEQLLCESCEACAGSGRVKSVKTVCYQILRELAVYLTLTKFEKLLIVAAPITIERLLDEESSFITEIEEDLGRPIEFRVETAYSQEQYDIVPV